jgi:hypothetical protein
MRDETARLSVPDVNILNGWFVKNARDGFFYDSVFNFFARDDPPVASVSFEDERELAEGVWKFSGTCVCGAGFFVHEDWAWGRIWIEAVERIVGEKDSALFSDIEGAQTLPARAGPSSELEVCWMAVLGRF